MESIGVLGSGSWATALVKILVENKVKVVWYIRKAHAVENVNTLGYNPNYLSYVHFDQRYVRASNDLKEVIGQSDGLLFATPSAYLADLVGRLKEFKLSGKTALVSIKGTVGEDNQIPSDYIHSQLDLETEKMVVLGGPCHAEEIAASKKTYMTVATADLRLAEAVGECFASNYIEVQCQQDLRGVEYAAIFKNVIGIACGLCKGLNYGDNFQAVVVANAIDELQRLLTAINGSPVMINNSSYLGDLLVTAYSPFSRNRMFGEMLGRGYNTPEAERAMSMVAEGYHATRGLYQLSEKLGIELPIVSAVYRVIFNHMSPYSEFRLLERRLR